jgi:hypothetical protein
VGDIHFLILSYWLNSALHAGNGGWSHYSSTSEPVIGYEENNMANDQIGIPTSYLSVTINQTY